MPLPHLRYVTQAGGRLAPDRVRHFAGLGARRGWQLFVMYGATEATSRMAYLPAELAYDNPTCIGRPVPGGSLDLEPLDDAPGEVGELVYRGANVMMGYAREPADLALGPTVDLLRTGDLARRHPNGMYEIVGRRSRFAKMYGLRIDLQRVEDALRDRGVTAICTEGDGLLLVAMLIDTVDRPDAHDAQRYRRGRRRAASFGGPRPRHARDPAPAVRKTGLPPGPRRRRATRATRRPRTRSDEDVRRRAADGPGHRRP